MEKNSKRRPFRVWANVQVWTTVQATSKEDAMRRVRRALTDEVGEWRFVDEDFGVMPSDESQILSAEEEEEQEP